VRPSVLIVTTPLSYRIARAAAREALAGRSPLTVSTLKATRPVQPSVYAALVAGELVVREARPGDARAIAEVSVASRRWSYRDLFAEAELDALSVEETAVETPPRSSRRSGTGIPASRRGGLVVGESPAAFLHVLLPAHRLPPMSDERPAASAGRPSPSRLAMCFAMYSASLPAPPISAEESE